eukprot:TRINITY_DN71153_c0_g1_i1.p1 TRINITY_DN71153_c0_g1~~TRINITY_DN71153_c0_g1_i1.p1  ORF type:complete len:140 (+),score=12.10 TRINITY_DN71153_c0_g1_i1:50-469(+)
MTNVLLIVTHMFKGPPSLQSLMMSWHSSVSFVACPLQDGRLVFDACAYLPENVQFKYRLRVGAIIAEIEGESCIFWDDPEIRVKTMWPLPDLWAPMVGVAGFRFPRQVKFSRIGFRDDGCIEVAGTLGQPDGALVVSSR